MREKSEYFIGELAPFIRFELEYHSLFNLVESNKQNHFYKDVNPAGEVALIGLLAYFEAFCKHQFAAILNIFPTLLRGFCSKRPNQSIDLDSLLTVKGNIEDNIGFIISEKYDFGSAKNINRLYHDLLGITILSKSESRKLDLAIYKRNLLVHHAGVYTLKYLKEHLLEKSVLHEVYKKALKIDTEDFHEIGHFIFELSCKINRVTLQKLKNELDHNAVQLNEIKSEAIQYMLTGMYDTFE